MPPGIRRPQAATFTPLAQAVAGPSAQASQAAAYSGPTSGQIDTRRALALQLMGNATQGPTGGPWGALAKALTGVAGAYALKRADSMEGDRNAALSAALSGAGGDLTKLGAVAGQFGDTELSSQVAVKQAELAAKGNEPYTLSPGQTRFGQGGSVLASLPEKQEPFTLSPGATRFGADGKPIASVSDFNQPFNPDGTPNTAYQGYEIGKAVAGKTSVNVSPSTVISKGETAAAEAFGKNLGEEYGAIQAGGRQASNKMAQVARLESMLSGIDTGAFKGTTTQIKAIARSAGIDLGALGITDDVDSVQAARAVQNAMAMEMRNPSGGAGMPGAMSDSDRKFLEQTVMNIENTPGANRMIAIGLRALARRDQEIAKLTRDYATSRPTQVPDAGMYDEIAKYGQSVPLFTPEEMAEIEKIKAGAGTGGGGAGGAATGGGARTDYKSRYGLE
jgi:hypothetical protein